jgi:hypothetical protein
MHVVRLRETRHALPQLAPNLERQLAPNLERQLAPNLERQLAPNLERQLALSSSAHTSPVLPTSHSRSRA